MKKFKNYILIVIGFIALFLGTVGIILPLLPTTPFYLLALACFSSSPKIRNCLMQFSFFRECVEVYKNRTGMSKVKLIKVLSFMWIALFISMYFTGKLWVTFLLIFIGICVTIHVVYMSKPKQK